MFCRASTSEEERAGSEACLSWLGLCEFFIWFSELASGARVRGLVMLESAAAYGYAGVTARIFRQYRFSAGIFSLAKIFLGRLWQAEIFLPSENIPRSAVGVFRQWKSSGLSILSP